MRAGLKLRQLEDLTPGEGFAPKAHGCRMLSDIPLIAPSQQQPSSMQALHGTCSSLCQLWRINHTVLGPAPAAPDTAMGVLLGSVMHLRLIICDVRSNKLQDLKLSLSQVLCLIENCANALIWSFSCESGTAYMAQTGVSAIWCICCQPCPGFTGQ